MISTESNMKPIGSGTFFSILSSSLTCLSRRYCHKGTFFRIMPPSPHREAKYATTRRECVPRQKRKQAHANEFDFREIPTQSNSANSHTPKTVIIASNQPPPSRSRQAHPPKPPLQRPPQQPLAPHQHSSRETRACGYAQQIQLAPRW
jgi:hypothetical protein